MKNFKTAIGAAMIGFAAFCASGAAEASCYRLGETGYHRYASCWGPRFMYPHQRVCRHGHCWYR